MLAFLVTLRAATCPGFFEGVRPNGAAVCIVRVDAGTLNEDPYTETRTPVRIHCRAREIAWLPDAHHIACRKAP